MTDRVDDGEEKKKSRERPDPRFHPPFYPPFYPPEPWPLDTASYGPFIEAQRGLLSWYRDQLEHHARDGGADDRLREALNALMASWLDAAQSFREHRERALRLQLDLVTRYLDVLNHLLDRPDDPKA